MIGAQRWTPQGRPRMDRRAFVGLTAGSTMAGGSLLRANAAGQPALGGAGAAWIGASALKGGKGYAPCPLGQLHFRSAGDHGRAPVLLIHQTPIGIAEFIDVQPALDRAGRRSIASDNPGYGLSDPPPGPVTVADMADNLAALLDHLAIDDVVVAGHHTGAAIAAAFAARHPGRTAAAVLHGCPIYTAEERAERLSRPSQDLALKPDGSHLSDIFKAIYALAGPVPASLSGATWATLGVYLAGADTPAYKAVFANDMAADLIAIRAPTLLLSDGADTLHENDRKAAALRPDFVDKTFSSGKSFSLMHEPDRWAGIVAAFAQAQGV